MNREDILRIAEESGIFEFMDGMNLEEQNKAVVVFATLIIAPYKADAERYSWLKETNLLRMNEWYDTEATPKGVIDTIFVWDGDSCADSLTPSEFDDAIDSQRNGGKSAPT